MRTFAFALLIALNSNSNKAIIHLFNKIGMHDNMHVITTKSDKVDTSLFIKCIK